MLIPVVRSCMLKASASPVVRRATVPMSVRVHLHAATMYGVEERPLLASTAFASMRRYMTITSPKLHGQHKVLNDTGAQFSSISLKLARQHRLHIVAPTSQEPRYLAMADRTKFVKRIGSVVLPVTVHFNGGTPREPYSCVKRLEVMNMDFDFIIGVDLLPSLFPADDVMNYLILPSRITSPPQLASSKEVQGVAERFGEVCTLVYAHGDQVPTQVEADDDILREYVNERVHAHFQALSACAFEDVPTLEPYVCSTAAVDDDSLTLTDQVVDEMGVGRTPPLEVTAEADIVYANRQRGGVQANA